MSPSHPIADREEVLRTLRREGPSTVTELMQAVGSDRGTRRQYRQVLRGMVRDGDVILDKKGRLSISKVRETAMHKAGSAPLRSGGKRRGTIRAAAPADTTVQGRGRRTRGGAVPDSESASPQQSAMARFDGHQDGFGFVNPTDGNRDVFIPPHRTGGALHGDIVEYKVTATRRDGRREGTVVRVSTPRGQRVVGLVRSTHPVVEVVPFDPRAGVRFLLKGALPAGVAEGVAVEIEIPRKGSGQGDSVRLLDILGPIDRPGVDLEVLIRKHDLRTAFSEEVLREAETLAVPVPEAELASREDHSRSTVVTIDGETAKDFDDAISISRRPGGGFELAVHIADVAHYVRPGGSIDIEARLRGTSVYFPGRAIPMLPPALSEEICSLRPDVPRLVQTVVMAFDGRGNLERARFSDGWIRSKARLTYGRVNAIFQGIEPETSLERDIHPTLLDMRDLAALLAGRRAARGGLDFDLPEPEVILDALGAAAGVRPASRGPAQRLIEEFMIVANTTVAAYLVDRTEPVLHRVHERPDPTKVAEFARVAAAFGHWFAPDPDGVEPADFRNLLDAVAGTIEERTLGKLLLRTMALARYAPSPLGHFGLAAPDYLHFTSPIRRYPDLVAHRALRAARRRAEAGPATGRAGAGRSIARTDATRREETAGAPGEELAHLGAECSRLERTAESAERESLAWKRAEVLAGRLGEEMAGTIASVTALGLFVEFDEVYAEGLIPVVMLPEDDFRFDPVRLTLIGERTGVSYKVGQRLRVLVSRVDRIAQRVELALAGTQPGASAGSQASIDGNASAGRARLRQGSPARKPLPAGRGKHERSGKKRS